MPILTRTSEQPDLPRRGAVWSLTGHERELDANLIRLPAGDEIPAHLGAEVDTLIHVVRGSGTLVTDDGEEELAPGDLALLPRRTRRGFRAGADGLEYLTVHRRRQALRIGRREDLPAPGAD
ncbi:cupin domain-containing protein [Brachybacterium sp. J153]|uniref:cupin domain-containing protein n=1 Tax=Brachybacterium sp. J153 TaxID=3116488 RepID=UPI002E77F0AF|nr:cupin domain-containing protein [Brachybacterium sp. J153]MEE1617210.1 cupin domain-containing protein [Brachybacterium sp. J153]